MLSSPPLVTILTDTNPVYIHTQTHTYSVHYPAIHILHFQLAFFLSSHVQSLYPCIYPIHATSLDFLSFDPHNDFSQWTQFIRLIMQFFHSPVTNPSSLLTDIHNKHSQPCATSGHLTLICFNHLNSDYTTGWTTEETWFDSLFFLLSELALRHHVISSMKNAQNCETGANKVKADPVHTNKVYWGVPTTWCLEKLPGYPLNRRQGGPKSQSGHLAPIMNWTLDLQLHSLLTILTKLLRLQWMRWVTAG
jgi:hypothetical protein